MFPMYRIGTLLAAGALLFSFPPSLRADEPAEKQLEFVRNLRDKGYSDLALEYLEKLKKQGQPGIKQFLAMEMARTRVALARDKEPEQRLALLTAARAELSEFIKANPSGPEGIQARLELARLVTQEGKAILNKALRKDDVKVQQQQALQAEQQFIQAGQELEAAIKLLGELAANYKNPDEEQQKLVREQAAEDAREASLDRGLNLMEQARTYVDKENSDLNRKRAEIIEQARKLFKELGALDDKNATCLMAVAWQIRGAQEAQEYQIAEAAYQRLINLKQAGKEADAAKRWARYFRLRTILDYPDFKLPGVKGKLTVLGKLQFVQKEALAWLAAYPPYRTSIEGQGVRFELGKAYYQEALGSKDIKSAKASAKLKQAQKEFAALAEGDSDFAEEANQLNLGISFALMGANTPVEQFKSFEDCYLKGHYELYQVKKPSGKEAEGTRKEHLKTAVAAFQRALKLADGKTPSNKLGEARFFLMTSYWLTGDAHRTAVAGEVLARIQPPQKRSPDAAGYALEAYTAILGRDKEENRQHFIDLANYILQQKAWEGTAVNSATHYNLAMVYQRDGKLSDAIAELKQLPPSFSGFTYAQGQLVFFALEARDKASTEAEKKMYMDKVLDALKRIPRLPANVDPSSAAMFFNAQLEYSKWLYGDGIQDLNNGDVTRAILKFKDMVAFNKQLQDQFAKLPVKLTKETSDTIIFRLGVYDKYAKLGQAEAEFKRGDYDKVLSPELTGAVVAEVKKEGQKNAGPIRMREFKVTGDVLGLALRASVQKGKVDDARDILKLLERLTGPEGEITLDPAAVLKGLIQEMEKQVEVLKKAGDVEKLKKTVASFTSFVDDLAKSAGQKKLQPADYFFLARCYDSLDQHCKAAPLYGKIAAPMFLGRKLNKGEDFKEQEESEIRTYWYAQVRYAGQLRQCTENKDNLKTAQKVLDNLLGHPNARFQLLAEKETYHILEDMGLYGKASAGWGKFMEKVKKNLGSDANLKDLYYDAYYHYVFSTYKYSQGAKMKGAKTERFWLRRAADFIVRLEGTDAWESVGQRFRELLQAEDPLRRQYEELKNMKK